MMRHRPTRLPCAARLQTFVKRNSVYVAFIIAGAFAGEKVGTARVGRGGGDGRRRATGGLGPAAAHAALFPRTQVVHSVGDGLWESHNQG